MSVSFQLNGNIQLTDSAAGTQALLHLFSALGYTGTNSSLVQAQSLSSGSNAITLPVSPVQALYIKNLHATNTILVTWTPNGGSSNPVLTLQPGGAIIFVESNTTSGITALNLNASGASTPVEYILLG